MKIIAKTLAFSLILSLMPIVSHMVAPDYQGFNLEAADDSKKIEKR